MLLKLGLGRNGGTEGEGVPAPAAALAVAKRTHAVGLSHRDPSLAQLGGARGGPRALSCPASKIASCWSELQIRGVLPCCSQSILVSTAMCDAGVRWAAALHIPPQRWRGQQRHGPGLSLGADSL